MGRISRGMQNRKYDHPCGRRNVEDKVRKFRNDSPANVPVHERSRLGESACRFQALAKVRQKLVAKTWLLRLVPLEDASNVMLRPRAKNDRPRHELRRIRANTSSRVDPESGSASNSASRRSSSSRCHSVSGSAWGAAAMLSQMASTSRTRSATESSRISATRLCFMVSSVPSSGAARQRACRPLRGAPKLMPLTETSHSSLPATRNLSRHRLL
jgi:hypothetical protein